jgi:PHD/YefM family antitoxin component YafN of YafNO toxin-antitoxin module
VATRIVPKTHLRDRIRDELTDLGDDTLVVTERGQPLAVLVSVGRWNTLQERLEDLEDEVAILEHRLSGETGAPAESVFSSIESELADVQRSARKAS